MKKFLPLCIALLLIVSTNSKAGKREQQRYTNIHFSEAAVAGSQMYSLDFPKDRCGGHANTGVRWTAPKAMTIDLAGDAWKIRERGVRLEAIGSSELYCLNKTKSLIFRGGIDWL